LVVVREIGRGRAIIALAPDCLTRKDSAPADDQEGQTPVRSLSDDVIEYGVSQGFVLLRKTR